MSEDIDHNLREIGELLDAHRKRQLAEYPKLTMTGMYSVLEKIRSKIALDSKERDIYEQGLVSILDKLHDDVDRAVFDAYGWPQNLTDEEILERLVVLNNKRSEEEKRGFIRWLRPEYQRGVVKLPKGVTEIETQPGFIHITNAKDKRSSFAPPIPERKKPWPKRLPERIAQIRDLIQSTDAGWTAEAVARSFKRAPVRTVKPVLESLAAVGILLTYEGKDGPRWKRVRREQD